MQLVIIPLTFVRVITTRAMIHLAHLSFCRCVVLGCFAASMLLASCTEKMTAETYYNQLDSADIEAAIQDVGKALSYKADMRAQDREVEELRKHYLMLTAIQQKRRQSAPAENAR